MGINIGLGPIKAQDDWEVRQQFHGNWACDWITLEFLENVTPVFDANMFRIYAAEYRKNIMGLSDQELSEYAEVYKPQITAYIYNNIFNRLYAIVNRWKAIADKKQASSIFSIPTNAKPAFDDFMTFVKIQKDANDTNQFIRFKSELLRNADDWFRAHHEDLDISKYIMPVDRFKAFIEVVEGKLDLCFKGSNVTDTIATDYHQKIITAIDYIKTMLLICNQVKVENHRISKNLFDKELTYLFGKYVKAVLPYVDKFNAVKPAHAVCIYASSVDAKLDLKEEPSGFVNTDEYRFLVATFAQEIMNNDMNRA